MKKAFTMAEAILVMVILGIIATIMISNMRPVEFRDRGLQVLAKKVLGQIDTATTQILFNNSANSTMTNLYQAGTTNQFSIKSNASYLQALYSKYLVSTRNKPNNTANGYCNGGVNMMLKDGTCLRFVANASAVTWIPGETKETSSAAYDALIYMDINDIEEPNILGKDRYVLPLNASGIAY